MWSYGLSAARDWTESGASWFLQLKELLAQLFPEPEYRETCRAAPQLMSADKEGERAKRLKTEESPRDADQAQQPQSASTASTGAAVALSFLRLPCV